MESTIFTRDLDLVIAYVVACKKKQKAPRTSLAQYIGRLVKRLERNSSRSGGTIARKNPSPVKKPVKKETKSSIFRTFEIVDELGKGSQFSVLPMNSLPETLSINPTVSSSVKDAATVESLIAQLRGDDCKATTRSILRLNIKGTCPSKLSRMFDQANKLLFEKVILEREHDSGLIINVIHHLFKCSIEEGSCGLWKVLLREIKVIFLTILYCLKGNEIKLKALFEKKQGQELNQMILHHLSHYFLKLFALTNTLLVNSEVKILAGHITHRKKRLAYEKSFKLSLCRRKLLKCIVEADDLDNMALYNKLQLEAILDDD